MNTPLDTSLDTLIARRRDFHRYPEAGWEEFRTTAKIAEILLPLGLELHFAPGFFKEPERDTYIMGRHVDADREKARAVSQGADPVLVARCGDYTGLCADLDFSAGGGGEKKPFTVLRFDIDCVETTESDDPGRLPARKGFLSKNPGRHHACGHDGHTAIGLALAERLKAEADAGRLCGKIRFIFQPAEEGVRGGYAMTQAGLVDGADYFLTLHLGLGYPTGTVWGGMGGFLCSTKFDARFTGTGAHAGAEPEKGRNALLGAAAAALALHGIAPHSGGKTRLNVGVLEAGEGRNVVPPRALMKIESRGETAEIADYLYRRSVEVLEGASRMYGLSLAVSKEGETIQAESSPALAALVAEAAAGVPGVKKAAALGQMAGSDDASWMMRRVQDGGGAAAYVGVGADISAGHHNESFDFDEAALPIAVETLFRTVKRLHTG